MSKPPLEEYFPITISREQRERHSLDNLFEVRRQSKRKLSPSPASWRSNLFELQIGWLQSKRSLDGSSDGPKVWLRISPKVQVAFLSWNPLDTLPKISSPFKRPFHVDDLGSLETFLELILWWVQYLYLSSLAHRESFASWNCQFNFARRAVFLPLADWRPRPPNSLGLVTSP